METEIASAPLTEFCLGEPILAKKTRRDKRIKREILEQITAEIEEAEFKKEFLENFPVLSDSKFLREYQDIQKVAEVLYLTADIHYRQLEKFVYFDKLRVRNLNGFLELLEEGNPDAKKVYEEIKDRAVFI